MSGRQSPTAAMSSAKDPVLRSAALSATYNIALQLCLRVVTFVANAFILRFIARDVLGVINVRYNHELGYHITKLTSNLLFSIPDSSYSTQRSSS